VFVTGDGPPLTIKYTTSTAQTVAVGDVVEVGSPTWNTPNGLSPDLSTRWPRGVIIYTPITIRTEATFKGSLPSTVVIEVPGGTLGCHNYLVEGQTIPAVGSRLVLFLGPSVNSAGVSDSSKPTSFEDWPVGVSDMVQTPAEGSVSLDNLRQIAAGAAK
jgi:hypothetical protein